MNIVAVIDKYIREELVSNREGELDPGESLISSGILDSLTLLQLISFLEKSFGITVDDDEMKPSNFETINQMRAFVDRKRR